MLNFEDVFVGAAKIKKSKSDVKSKSKPKIAKAIKPKAVKNKKTKDPKAASSKKNKDPKADSGKKTKDPKAVSSKKPHGPEAASSKEEAKPKADSGKKDAKNIDKTKKSQKNNSTSAIKEKPKKVAFSVKPKSKPNIAKSIKSKTTIGKKDVTHKPAANPQVTNNDKTKASVIPSAEQHKPSTNINNKKPSSNLKTLNKNSQRSTKITTKQKNDKPKTKKEQRKQNNKKTVSSQAKPKAKINDSTKNADKSIKNRASKSLTVKKEPKQLKKPSQIENRNLELHNQNNGWETKEGKVTVKNEVIKDAKKLDVTNKKSKIGPKTADKVNNHYKNTSDDKKKSEDKKGNEIKQNVDYDSGFDDEGYDSDNRTDDKQNKEKATKQIINKKTIVDSNHKCSTSNIKKQTKVKKENNQIEKNNKINNNNQVEKNNQNDDDDSGCETEVSTKKEIKNFINECINKIKVKFTGDDIEQSTVTNDIMLTEKLKKLIENQNIDLENNIICVMHQLHRMFEAIYRADPQKTLNLNKYSEEELSEIYQIKMENVYKIPIEQQSLFYTQKNIKIRNLEETKTKHQIICEHTKLGEYDCAKNNKFYELAKKLEENDNHTPVFFVHNHIANEKVRYTEEMFQTSDVPERYNMYFNAQMYFMARYLSNTKTVHTRQLYHNKVIVNDNKHRKIFIFGHQKKHNSKQIAVINKFFYYARLDLKNRTVKQLVMIYCFNPLCHCTNHENTILSLECLTKLLTMLLFHNNNNKFTIRYKIIYAMHKIPAMASFLYLVQQKYEYFQKNPFKSTKFRLKISFRCENTTYIGLDYVTQFCIDLERFIYATQCIHFNERKEHKEGINDTEYFKKICNENINDLQSTLYARMINIISTLYISKSMNNFKREIDVKIDAMYRLEMDSIVLENYKHIEVMLHQIFTFVPLFGIFDEYELLVEPDLGLTLYKHYDKDTKLIVAKGSAQDLMQNKIFLKYYVENVINQILKFLLSTCCFSIDDVQQYAQYQKYWEEAIVLYTKNRCANYVLV
ncbi:hypothetical protein BDAP_002865 [Binucleata daphniae]